MLSKEKGIDALDVPRLNLVPSCPVSDSTKVEIRLGLPLGTDGPIRIAVGNTVVFEGPPTPGQTHERLVVVWWETRGRKGRYPVDWSVTTGRGRARGRAHIEVVPSPTVGLNRFGGAWIEPGAIPAMASGGDASRIESMARNMVDSMHAVGIGFIIIAYVEAGGVWYTPAQVPYEERSTRSSAVPLPNANEAIRPGKADIVGAILSQASKRGMGVFVGLSRGGDMHLLWQFDDPNWDKRNREALAIGRAMADALHARYGRERSFQGWYLTHEANDLPKAAAYYDPLAIHCRSLAPERVVMAAPSGTPIASPSVVAASKLDIFCWQDAVGSGYVPYVNTWDPSRRIAMLPEIFERYRSWHANNNKHCWSDLEVWEMDGKSGYSNPYPPTFERVQRQIEIESQWVPVLTAYAWPGYLHPERAEGQVDPRARALLSRYRRWIEGAKR